MHHNNHTFEFITMNTSTFTYSAEILILTKRFNFLCNQVIILNNQIMDIDLKINKAKLRKSHKSFIYSYHLRVISLEGTRKAFYDLAFILSERIYELKKKEKST